MDPIYIPPTRLIEPREIYRPTDNPNRMTVEEYDSLKNFIRVRGFLQSVEVYLSDPAVTDLPYTIVDGDHRTRIALELAIPQIPAMVVEASEADRLRDRIGLNRHRGQLDVVAVGRDLERLLHEFDYSAEDVATTGFSNEETLELLDALKPRSGEEVLRDSVGAPPEDVEDINKKWSMSLNFDSEAERARVRARILEHADGGSLATGMVNLIHALDDATDA